MTCTGSPCTVDKSQIVISSSNLINSMGFILIKFESQLFFQKFNTIDGSNSGTQYINNFFSGTSTIKQMISQDQRIYILLENFSEGVLCIYDEQDNDFEQCDAISQFTTLPYSLTMLSLDTLLMAGSGTSANKIHLVKTFTRNPQASDIITDTGFIFNEYLLTDFLLQPVMMGLTYHNAILAQSFSPITTNAFLQVESTQNGGVSVFDEHVSTSLAGGSSTTLSSILTCSLASAPTIAHIVIPNGALPQASSWVSVDANLNIIMLGPAPIVALNIKYGFAIMSIWDSTSTSIQRYEVRVIACTVAN